MKRAKQKIVTTILFVVLSISVVVGASIHKNSCLKKAAITHDKVCQKQKKYHKNIMIFNNCIDYFSNLSKKITQ